VRVIDSQSASVAITMLALAVQRRLDRGTTDEEIDALVERYLETHGLLFTVDTLEFLARGGRIG
jgi:fatty acid-binding protein DegV